MPFVSPADFTTLRVVPEHRIVQHLLATTHPYQVRAGAEGASEAFIRDRLERWVAKGLAFASANAGPGGSERLFDPAEVVNFYVRLGLLGEDDLWPVHYVGTCRRLVLESQGRDSRGVPPLPMDLPPRRFSVRFERTFDLSGMAQGAAVRLRLPAPIEDDALRNLDIRIHAPPHATVSREPGRIEARLKPGGESGVTVGLDAAFDAYAHGAHGGSLTPADRELYTRGSQLFVRVDDAVTRRVAALPLGDMDDGEAATAIYRSLLPERHGVVQYGDIDLAEPLARCMASGWYDCQVEASLFCAMCRARGIPARVVSGYPLHRQLPLLHYWAEAWVDGSGWVPYDFYAWPLSAGCRDAEWTRLYEGAIDYRMKVQVFPRLFTGTGSVRFPQWWHMTASLQGDGIEMAYESATGELIYRDRIRVE